MTFVKIHPPIGCLDSLLKLNFTLADEIVNFFEFRDSLPVQAFFSLVLIAQIAEHFAELLERNLVGLHLNLLCLQIFHLFMQFLHQSVDLFARLGTILIAFFVDISVTGGLRKEGLIGKI